MIEYLKAILTVQLFWAFCISLLVATLPAAIVTDELIFFSGIDNNNTMQELGDMVGTGTSDQFDVPFLDFTTLIFYSSNLFFTLLTNFVFAVPQMLSLLIRGIFLFIPVAASLKSQLLVFFNILVIALYFIGIIALVLNLRSAGGGFA